jgi:hypothetical protein
MGTTLVSLCFCLQNPAVALSPKNAKVAWWYIQFYRKIHKIFAQLNPKTAIELCLMESDFIYSLVCHAW